MALYGSPSDDEVSTELGPLVGSWRPRPLAEIAEQYFVVVNSENNALGLVTQIGAFLAAAASGVLIGKAYHSLQIGVICSALIFGTAVAMFVYLGKKAYQQVRLSIFENGFRLGRQRLRFEDVKSIEVGAPATVGEKYTPTLSSLQKSCNDLSPVKRMIRMRHERSRRTALTIDCTNGKRLIWLSFCAIFSEGDLVDFFAAFSKLAPHLAPEVDLNVVNQEPV